MDYLAPGWDSGSSLERRCGHAGAMRWAGLARRRRIVASAGWWDSPAELNHHMRKYWYVGLSGPIFWPILYLSGYGPPEKTLGPAGRLFQTLSEAGTEGGPAGPVSGHTPQPRWKSNLGPIVGQDRNARPQLEAMNRPKTAQRPCACGGGRVGLREAPAVYSMRHTKGRIGAGETWLLGTRLGAAPRLGWAGARTRPEELEASGLGRGAMYDTAATHWTGSHPASPKGPARMEMDGRAPPGGPSKTAKPARLQDEVGSSTIFSPSAARARYGGQLTATSPRYLPRAGQTFRGCKPPTTWIKAGTKTIFPTWNLKTSLRALSARAGGLLKGAAAAAAQSLGALRQRVPGAGKRLPGKGVHFLRAVAGHPRAIPYCGK